MSEPAPPSSNNANDDSLAGFFSFAMKKFLQGTDDMLPAKVIAYNRQTNRATVQPLIPFVTTSKERVPRARVASIPVLQLGGGGFIVSAPLVPGDLGWIKANDRDISNFKASYSEATPNTQRQHKFSDAMFIPDVMMRGVTIAGGDSANLVIQSLSGDVKISLGTDKMTLTAPEIEIIGGDIITMTAPEIHFDSPNLDCGGTRFDTHVHTGVQPGGGETGSPTNP